MRIEVKIDKNAEGDEKRQQEKQSEVGVCCVHEEKKGHGDEDADRLQGLICSFDCVRGQGEMRVTPTHPPPSLQLFKPLSGNTVRQCSSYLL